MDLVLDLLQGIGLAAAIGIRPFLPTLLAGALAAANLGLDFGGTDFAFLEKWPFLLAVLVLVGALEYAGRRRAGGVDAPRALVIAVAAVAVVLGALEAAGSLADRGHAILPGIVLGAAAAVLGFAAAHTLFARVRRRLDADTAGALPLYGEGAALAAAGLSILFPPLAVLVVAGLAWLLVGGRRREGEKYAGLRVLR
jgi:Na+-translocating ferredoxin:NAD+ oxidoreductase RnfA subunit